MTLYDILEVSSKATEAEIKQAYRKLALKHHPDRGGNGEKFHSVSDAYKILSNQKLRVEYDKTFLRQRGWSRAGSTSQRAQRPNGRPSTIFGPIYDEFISKLDTEGVTLSNVDDLLGMVKNVAEETKANVSKAVNSSSSKYEELLSEIFGDHVTFGKGR